MQSKEYVSGLSQLEMIDTIGDSSGLIHTSDLEKPEINFYQKISLEKAKKVGADAVYFRNFPDSKRSTKPQLYIFDFTSSERDITEIHKNVWSSTEVRLYIVISKSEIRFFNSSKPVEHDLNGELSVSPFDSLKIAGDAIKKYKEYSGKKFDNGSFWEETQYDFGYSETAYEKLISELKKTRDKFLEIIQLEKMVASKLLVLGILVKYLEERVDTDEDGIETRVFTSDFFNQKDFGYASDFTETIRKGNKFTLNLFEYLGNHFNGKIFHISEEYKKQLKGKDLSPLADFLSGMLENQQFVFWKLYSFNHLPIELISSIYEMFLEADKSKGVAYTPSYLVDFMVDECMPIDEPKKNFKVLDPACGSGIFLVSAYKRIIDWWRVSNYEKTENWIKPGKENLDELKRLLKNNIYGIDFECEAVDLAIFSLSLTLCDILSPKVIWENLRFDDLSDNVVGSDFFDWYIDNKKKKFDLVIGNPPFIEYGAKEEKINSLVDGLNLKEQVPNNQSALLFTILGMQLVKKETGLLSFVLPSGPLLYNNSQYSINFRKWLFGKYNIPQIIDFTYLSNVLFKNKGNKKNVAVSAFFLQSKVPDENPIYHITVKKLKSAKERQYFEIDHYDFHRVSKSNALQNPHIWKSNLLGGGRLVSFINRLATFQTLKEFLEKKKSNGWVYGDGFIKGKKDELLVESDFEKKKGGYSEAPYLMDAEYVEPEDFTESGITTTKKNTEKYFQWPRNENIFKPSLLLIKKNIGSNSIPVFFSDKALGFKNEIIGIHSPVEEKAELKKVYDRIKDNSLYRFYILTTSARSGVSRSTKTVLQKDILGLPFPEKKEEIELTKFDKILVNDTLKYGLDFLGKETNVKVLKESSEKELISFGKVFCEILNSLFKTDSKKYYQKDIYQMDSFTCVVFDYGKETTITKKVKNDLEVESHIAELVYNKMGSSYRINRVIEIYEGDLIYLIKPKELRYWLQSIALRDADETIVDLYNAGY